MQGQTAAQTARLHLIADAAAYIDSRRIKRYRAALPARSLIYSRAQVRAIEATSPASKYSTRMV